MYWINFQNIYTFTYKKTLLHKLLLRVFKIVENLQCILKWSYKKVFYDNFFNVKFSVSSIVYWDYQDNFKPVYFLLTKRFRAHKNMSHLEVYARVKNCCLFSLVLAYFCFVTWFLLVTCFCAREIFSSKKK